MWPLTKVSNEQVTVCIRPTTLVCCLVQRASKRALLQVKAYKRFDLDVMAVTPYTLANPTVLERCIHEFLTAYNVHDARINLVISHPHVSQNIVTLPTAAPEPSQVRMQGKKQTLWDYYYLYPTEDSGHAFYTCAVDQALLLQYKLMAVRMQLNLATVTTQHTALFNMYRHAYGAAFRTSQLAVDMRKHGNTPEHLFTRELLQRVVVMPENAAVDLQSDGIDILSSCGLFVMGDEA